MTRQQEVLDRLLAADGEWVDGSELATALIGGSEGLKRLRELRAEGHPIEERRHPDPRRAIWQYRLIPPRLMKKVPKVARVVPGQTQAFFDEPLHALRGSDAGAGTLLDPAWTHSMEIGYYDESQRLLQVPIDFALFPKVIHFPAMTLARYLGKVDWIEVVDGRRCLRISGLRFEHRGVAFNDAHGARRIGAPIDEWDEIVPKET